MISRIFDEDELIREEAAAGSRQQATMNRTTTP
jgi:hypothetical protein